MFMNNFLCTILYVTIDFYIQKVLNKLYQNKTLVYMNCTPVETATLSSQGESLLKLDIMKKFCVVISNSVIVLSL